MARKKRAVRRKRRMSEGGLSRRKTRRSSPRRRRRGLSATIASVTGSNIGTQITNTLSGFVGGYAGGAITDMVLGQNASPTQEFFLNVALAGAAGYAGMSHVGAGIAGGYAQRLRSRGGMHEEHPYANPDTMNEMPVFLDEAGNEMVLGDDGNFYYMDEGGGFQLAAAAPPELLAEQAPYLLAHSNYLPGYIPGSYGQ